MTDTEPTPVTGKPRIALLGEFSAGKSTLANLLLERASSPVQVTATQVPPVWYALGPDGAAGIVAPDGSRAAVPGGDWSGIGPADAQLIEVRMQADLLEAADLIDMPGTSDPSLSARYWEHILPQVDLAIWCTPANQAWRQSEAALWAEAPPDLRAQSLLLVTRMDQIRAEADRARILARVEREAGGGFARVLPISLTEALAAPEDDAALERCGAAGMLHWLVAALDAAGPKTRPPYRPLIARPPSPASQDLRPERPDAVPGAIVPRQITPRRRVGGGVLRG